MRLFQCTTLYPGYLNRLNTLARFENTFAARQTVFLADRHGAAHFLKPILDREPAAFEANVNDHVHQRMWARENGMLGNPDPIEILLAQIEHHRTEVLYSMDPVALPTSFIRRLPSCVKKTIGWRAAPTKGADLTAYDLIVSNFPKLLREYEANGCKVATFYPAHDPEQDHYAANQDRPVDAIFVGSYTRHHGSRNKLLEEISKIGDRYKVVIHLETSHLTKQINGSLLRWVPFLPNKLPATLRKVARAPVFGINLYEALSRAKVVVNCSIDNAGEERGNIRCFEAMGCGCVMLSDEGRYPEEMKPGDNMMIYHNPLDAVTRLEELLAEPTRLREIGTRAHASVSRFYSKDRQLQAFYALAS